MKATWILILFLVSQSDCRPRNVPRHLMPSRNVIGGLSGRGECVGQLSLYQGDLILEQIEYVKCKYFQKSKRIKKP